MGLKSRDLSPKHKNFWLRLAIVCGIAALSLNYVRAGTIINTNLPAGSLIINISGTADGAASYGGSTSGLSVIGTNQDDWYQPFNVGGNLLENTFPAGTYNFRIINQSTAQTMFPSLTAGQISEISTGAWTYNTPWVTDWLAFDSSAASNSSEHQLFAGAVTPEAPGTTGWDGAGYDNSTDAYNEAINDGDYNEIVTGAGRYTGTVQSSYTFAAPQTLIFVVADYDVGDNAGSVSVLATPVPEPVTLGFFAMSALALRLRRLRSRA
jgi:hypothetical protein